MAGNNWLTGKHGEVAIDRILDSAGELFARKPAASVGMHEIATAAGCSRATVYRYFENREALHTAYVHREAHAVHAMLIECLAGIDDPREKLVTGFLEALKLVRNSPALRSWFSSGDAPIGAEIAEQSDVIKAMSAAFIASLGGGDPDSVDRQARWLVRILTSMLIFPGHDAEDEKAMVEEFLLPALSCSDRT